MSEKTGAGHRTGVAKRIWLHICREGGKWTPDEMCEVVGMPRQSTALVMHRMSTRGRQLKRSRQGNRAVFGVTVDCAIPVGITVKELAEVGVVAEVL